MKYLLVFIVVVGGLWWLLRRELPGGREGGAESSRRGAAPQAMVRCAHCGVHLPAADAVLEGSRVYCSDGHRRLGPASGD